MNRSYDLAEAIRRIRAFEEAGADLLYVPVPPGLDELRQIVAAVAKPVNALAVGPLARVTMQQFAEAGVRRISLGSALARVTHAVIRDRMLEIIASGDFSGLKAMASGSEIDAMLIAGSGDSDDD